MAKPLDGIVLLAYFRRLGLSQEAQELLTHIRTSPPSRTPGARRGNMPVWYPSKKMQCIVKAESAKVEFPFLLAAEHDDDILEVWDQPPAIPLPDTAPQPTVKDDNGITVKEQNGIMQEAIEDAERATVELSLGSPYYSGLNIR